MRTFDYKKLIKEELDDIFGDFPFKLSPMRHQLISMAFAAASSRCAFLHGVGTGKTLTALWTTQLWENKKILVVCPSSAFSAWERDISKYTDYSHEFLLGSGKHRRSLLKKKRDIFIINYEGLKTVYCKLMKGKGWKINYSSFIHKFDCIILDEIHKCKSYKSLQSIICHQLSKLSKNVIGLTGTPIDNSLLEAFNIYRVIDLGRTLGTSFFAYRNRYFYPVVFDWKLKKGAKEKILEQISKTSISFDREECFDLPEIQEIVREVNPSKGYLKLQDAIITQPSITLNGTIVKLEPTELNEDEDKFKKLKSRLLRQLPLGFLYYKTEDGPTQTYYLKQNPKIESLIDFLEDISGKVIIFYYFKEEVNMIQRALEKEKYLYSRIYGGQDLKERTESVKRFTQEEKVKCILVQRGAGAEGWDGTASSTILNFSPTPSPLSRKQTTGRIHRKGQKNTCLVVDLIMKSSVEPRTLKNRSERFDFVTEVMAYIQEYGGVEK